MVLSILPSFHNIVQPQITVQLRCWFLLCLARQNWAPVVDRGRKFRINLRWEIGKMVFPFRKPNDTYRPLQPRQISVIWVRIFESPDETIQNLAIHLESSQFQENPRGHSHHWRLPVGAVGGFRHRERRCSMQRMVHMDHWWQCILHMGFCVDGFYEWCG